MTGGDREIKLGIVVHTFNPSIQETEFCEFKANLIYIVRSRKAKGSGI